MNHKRTPYFKNLDIVRLLAALMVVMTHLVPYLFIVYGIPNFLKHIGSDDLNTMGKCVKTFFNNMTIGVDVFFILSGFLITSLLIDERERNNKIDLKKFYIRRILRIWPLYYLMIGVSYLFTRYYTHEIFPNYLPYIFFIGNFDMIRINGFGPGQVNILWSICIEEHFYLFIPLILAYVPIKKLPAILFSVVIICISYRIFSVLHYDQSWFRVYFHTLCRIDVIAIGCILAYIFHFYKNSFSLPPFIRSLLIIWVVYILSFFDAKDYGTWYLVGFFRYLYIIPIAILFMDYVSSYSTRLREGRVLSLINYLGKSSYSIYMWHIYLIILVCKGLDLLSIFHQNIFVYIVLIISAIAVFCSFTYQFFELPILNLKRKFEV